MKVFILVKSQIMEKGMGLENWFFLMNPNMKEILKIMNLMDMGFIDVNHIYIKVIISVEKRMVKEYMKI